METKVEQIPLTDLGIIYAVGVLKETLPDGRVVVEIAELQDEQRVPRFVGARLVSSLDRVRGLFNVLLTTVIGYIYTYDRRTDGMKEAYSFEVSATNRIPVKLQPGKGTVYTDIVKEHGQVDPVSHIPGLFYNTVVSPMYRTKPMADDPGVAQRFDNFDAKINSRLHEHIKGILAHEKYLSWIGDIKQEPTEKQPVRLQTVIQGVASDSTGGPRAP